MYFWNFFRCEFEIITLTTTIFMQNAISSGTTGKLHGHISIESKQISAKDTSMMLKESLKS